MTGQGDRITKNGMLALLKRDADRRAWLTTSFQGVVPPVGEMRDLDQVRARFATLSHISCGSTASGLSGRAFFGSHVQAILQEEADPSEFSIGFVKIRNGASL